jgi:hypothetical protein
MEWSILTRLLTDKEIKLTLLEKIKN